MKHKEGTFVGSGGLQLIYQSWHPQEDTRAVLVIVHGFGEHSGRYMNVVNHLVPEGFAVYSFDHRGHGRSPGQRGHIDDFAQFRGDVRAFLEMVAAREPDRPLFLMGHSLGGLIVLDYALHYPQGLQGVIASAPAVGQIGASPILLAIGRLLSRIWPTFSLEAGLDADALSRDQDVVRAYENDPLVHGRASARLSTEIADAAQWCQAHAAELALPLLILHGDADRLTEPAGSRRFFDKVTYPDKERLVYQGGYHESHNDIHWQQVVIDLEQWLAQHI